MLHNIKLGRVQLWLELFIYLFVYYLFIYLLLSVYLHATFIDFT